MAYTTIKKPSDYFNTLTYTGTGVNPTTFTGVGFQPDFCWFKARNFADPHQLYDSVRGVHKYVRSNENSAEGDDSGSLQAFTSDGFTLGNSGNVNGGTNQNLVAWNWKANGAGVANTDGSISSTVSANTTAGFSISKYDGTGANATFGHGLGVKPDIVFWKRLDSNDGTVNWIVQSPLLGNQNKLVLNTAEATSTGSSFSQTDNWTNILIDLKTYEGENDSNGTYIAYAFASKAGYSKIGSYTGNGNADGTFVYTGFKPAWLMAKRTDANATWVMYDNKRDIDNPSNHRLLADSTNAELVEDANTNIDFLSNGFKTRNGDSDSNASGGNYIYMAFAEEPLVGDNPATAR